MSDSFRLKLTKTDLIFLASLSALTVFTANAWATPVDDLETETAKLTDIYDDIVPVAVGAAAFSVGMMMIKRVAFA